MKKKWVKIGSAVLVVVIVAVAIIVMSGVGSGSAAAASAINVTELYKGTLVNSISTKGQVESAEKSNVFSTSNLMVTEVFVEVGDHVTQGQALCKLDTQNLELDIAKASADIDDTNRNASSQVANAQSSLISAELDLNTKKSIYETSIILYEEGAISQNDYQQSENAYINAQNKYADAQLNLQNTQKSAVMNSQSINIQKLQKQLSDARITAPQSGVVTAVYAKEGTPSNGLLFVIEDIENLKVVTTIKEYDIGNVHEGMPVTIKSDSTGNEEYKGILSKVNPTAAKNTSGETNSISGIEFEAEIKIVSAQTDLKIGMETRLDIELERKDNVYSVPFDAVKTTAAGESTIFIAEGNTARQIVVTTGMETDFYIEISGNDLKDGMKAIGEEY